MYLKVKGGVMTFTISSKIEEALAYLAISILTIYSLNVSTNYIDMKAAIGSIGLLMFSIAFFSIGIYKLNFKEQKLTIKLTKDGFWIFMIKNGKTEKTYFRNGQIAVSPLLNTLLTKKYVLFAKDNKHQKEYEFFLKNKKKDIEEFESFLKNLNKQKAGIVNKSLDYVYGNKQLYFNIFEDEKLLFLEYQPINLKDIKQISYKEYYTMFGEVGKELYNELNLELTNGKSITVNLNYNRVNFSSIEQIVERLKKYIPNTEYTRYQIPYKYMPLDKNYNIADLIVYSNIKDEWICENKKS